MKGIGESLKELGLEEKEATIYLAVLQSGRASLSDIAKDTHIRRTTIYQHVNTLLKRGFLSKSLKGKRILYAPESPQKILDSFERGKASFVEHMPHLGALYENARHRPNVRLYEGIDGITKILDEIGSSLLPIDAFFSPEKFFREVPKKDSDRFLLAIEKNENVLRDLVEHDAVAETFIQNVKKNENSFHKVKLLPKDFPIAVDVLMTGKTVAMISFDNLVGLIVENAEIATFHKSIHSFFWKNLS